SRSKRVYPRRRSRRRRSRRRRSRPLTVTRSREPVQHGLPFGSVCWLCPSVATGKASRVRKRDVGCISPDELAHPCRRNSRVSQSFTSVMRTFMRRKKSRSERLALATVLVLSFSLVGVLGQRQYVRATTQETWVAAKPLSAGQVVGRGDLAPGRVNGSSPPGMVAQLDQIVGRRLAVDKAEGEAFG